MVAVAVAVLLLFDLWTELIFVFPVLSFLPWNGRQVPRRLWCRKKEVRGGRNAPQLWKKKFFGSLITCASTRFLTPPPSLPHFSKEEFNRMAYHWNVVRVLQWDPLEWEHFAGSLAAQQPARGALHSGSSSGIYTVRADFALFTPNRTLSWRLPTIIIVSVACDAHLHVRLESNGTPSWHLITKLAYFFPLRSSVGNLLRVHC